MTAFGTVLLRRLKETGFTYVTLDLQGYRHRFDE